MVWTSSHFIPDRSTGRALAHAALTTISIPSALGAIAVVVFLWRRPSLEKVIATTVTAVLTCGLIAAIVSVFLVSRQLAASRLFADAIPSAALGGAISAAQITRRRKANL
jgi:hypothetical protein